MLDEKLWVLAALYVGCVGCGTAKQVGGNPDDGTADGSGTANDGTADDGTPGDGTADDDGGDSSIPGVCPEVPGSCLSPECEDGSCSGPLAEFDIDGCLRARCGPDSACSEGRTCVALDEWGACVGSTTVCEVNNGVCACGGTADCTTGVSICVPDDEAPPPIDECVAGDPGAGFTFTPAIGEVQGEAECTVQSVDPLEFDCAGDFTGVYTLDLYASSETSFAIDQAVTIHYWFEAQTEYANEWLRITTEERGLSEPVVAVSADSLLPPGVTAGSFWMTNVEISAGDNGCPTVFCLDSGGETLGQAVVANGAEFAASAAGTVPGKFGGETVTIQVREARLGACGASLGDQDAWYAFTLLASL